MTAYEFERPFRLKIISLLLDNNWLSLYGLGLIKPEYFEQEDESAVVGALIYYRQQYGRAVMDPADAIALAGSEYAKLVDYVFDLFEGGDNRLAIAKVIEFAKEQAAKLAILDSVDDVNKGNISLAIERMHKALEVGEQLLSPGIDPIADVDK